MLVELRVSGGQVVGYRVALPTDGSDLLWLCGSQLARDLSLPKLRTGQYFTPRALIEAMVRCVRPTADDTVVDPACGTGGFLLAAHEYIQREHGDELSTEDARRLRSGGISGIELVHGTGRLAQMNLLLHGIGEPGGKALIDVRDALARQPRGDERASLVLANPPFGRKSAR